MATKKEIHTGLLLINYQINSLKTHTEGFQNLIEEYPHKQISDSSYIIQTELSPKLIYKNLKAYLSYRDTLIISPFAHPYHGRANSDMIEWLSERI